MTVTSTWQPSSDVTVTATYPYSISLLGMVVKSGQPVQHDYGACGMRTRSDKGQATVLTLVFLVVLLGMAALVLDVGSWYRADRAVQSTADAAALAGAQSTAVRPGQRVHPRVQYGDKNGGGVNGSGITISNSSLGVNDTITVHLTRPAPGVFTKLFGVNSVTVGAHATARASLMQQAQYIAPIGVNLKHPKLKGTVSCPCFGTGNPTTLPLGKTGAPGAFDLLNVDGSHGGTGPQTLADWILKGYSGYLPSARTSRIPARSGTPSPSRTPLRPA